MRNSGRAVWPAGATDEGLVNTMQTKKRVGHIGGRSRGHREIVDEHGDDQRFTSGS
jgi:hypothetical protein